MSMGIIGAVAGVASVVGGVYSANKASDSAASNLAFNQDVFDMQMGYYDEARDYFTAPATYIGEDGNEYQYEDGRSKSLQSSMEIAGMLGAPAMTNATAYTSEAEEVDFSEFLLSFEEAINTNEQALTEFNRRYGSIMDNVADSISQISADKIAAQGREQLSLDAETIRNQFTEQMASSGIGRSGMSTEMEMRVQADVAEQARAIDVNSEFQANDLRNSGVQMLNSMEGLQQGIYQRGENIYQNQAAGQLQGAITDANNLTQVNMQNAANKTNVSMANANAANQGALAAYSMRSSALLSGLNAQNSFYSNTAMPGTAGVNNASNVQTSNYNADAAGYMKTAGNLFSSDTVQGGITNMFSGSDNGWMY